MSFAALSVVVFLPLWNGSRFLTICMSVGPDQCCRDLKMHLLASRVSAFKVFMIFTYLLTWWSSKGAKERFQDYLSNNSREGRTHLSGHIKSTFV